MTDKHKIIELRKEKSDLIQDLKDKDKEIKRQSLDIRDKTEYIALLEKECSDLSDKLSLSKVTISKIRLNAKGITEYVKQLEQL